MQKAYRARLHCFCGVPATKMANSPTSNFFWQRVHSALNSKRTGAAQEKDKCRMNIDRCKFTLMTGSYQCQFQIVGHLGPHFVSGKLETTSWSAYDDYCIGIPMECNLITRHYEYYL